MGKQNVFENGSIEIHDAQQNNLHHVSLKIPKKKISVFVGLSGSGKSSLVFDTLAALSRRELNETFPSFTQQYLPKYGQPHVKEITNLPVAIVIEQKKLTANARSTVATYTGIYSLLRLLYSRIGKPFAGYSDSFSFNLPQGMCPRCQGLGYVDEVDEQQLIDPQKSLNEGAITFVSFGPQTWRWKRYANSGLFDNDKPLVEYSKHEYELLMHAPQQKLKDPPADWYKSAKYEGLVPRIKRSILYSKEGKHHQEALAKIVTQQICPECHGARLRKEALACLINGKNIAAVTELDLVALLRFLGTIKEPLAAEIVRQLQTKIQSLIDIGLGYLTLARQTGTLSGGEAQRIKIAKYLTSSLSDLVYVLDEPSVGLHPYDIKLLEKALRKLKNKGNTIIIVEHNPAVIAFADYVVELGPAAGAQGGQLTFCGTFQEMLASSCLTSKWLQQKKQFTGSREATKMLQLKNAKLHNLKAISVAIPLGVMTVISGVAGSGKSSLVAAVKEKLQQPYVDFSQTPVGTNIRSTPVTYLNILPAIRKLFGKANQVSTQLFSYNSKGACPRCKGKGVTITNMAFMDPVVQLCELCNGKRYNQEALGYRYHGKNIAEVLHLSVKEAHTFFATEPEISQKLAQLERVGLAYLKLEQPLTTLSGGELQRLKLAFELNHQGQVYLFDEPTAGLHMKDIAKLLRLFNELVAQGNSVILIEHNLDVIMAADWLIDLGPGAGLYGGELMYSGKPRAAMAVPNSRTGAALKEYLAGQTSSSH